MDATERRFCYGQRVKTISLDDLHRQTGEFVRLATTEDIVVMDSGQPVVLLKRFPENGSQRLRWQERERALAPLPPIETDSTDYVSEDRNGR